jgi:hypothetical protein
MNDTFDTALAEINDRLLALQNQRYLLAKGVVEWSKRESYHAVVNSGEEGRTLQASLTLARDILGEGDDEV